MSHCSSNQTEAEAAPIRGWTLCAGPVSSCGLVQGIVIFVKANKRVARVNKLLNAEQTEVMKVVQQAGEERGVAVLVWRRGLERFLRFLKFSCLFFSGRDGSLSG